MEKFRKNLTDFRFQIVVAMLNTDPALLKRVKALIDGYF
jgi:hypothetical protein